MCWYLHSGLWRNRARYSLDCLHLSSLTTLCLSTRACVQGAAPSDTHLDGVEILWCDQCRAYSVPERASASSAAGEPHIHPAPVSLRQHVIVCRHAMSCVLVDRKHAHWLDAKQDASGKEVRQAAHRNR